MKFEVTILGSSSATPIFNRNPSAQVLNVNERLFLIDCGEGTQQQLLKNGIKAQRLNHIFISHLHGDHYLGLVGLLSSLHLYGRTRPMYVFGPPELKEILDIQFKYSQTELRYPLEFYATQAEKNELIYENPDIRIETFPLEHRIPCTGFRFNQKKRLPKIIKEKVEELGIPIEMIPLIKRGIDFTDKKGVVHAAAELTQEADPPRSYAYCSDTICNWKYIDQIQGVSTLYHEATFMHDMSTRAAETFHTTSLEAAQIAAKAGAEQLLLGHFSARYRELEPLQEEARTVFANAKLALEGHTFAV
ncbi:ribonuclease Z [Arcticibacter pallidicorallinus]|uniref:Ribonuclease Z n=1 Tax=Arcticibacter pallidicorallinus TaxID=1259464 RepID=A0A2T0U3A1_9SPHI|nr:ribonuclease Z [Arcticibacter pallidicorallinus]PRY52395.1 ribonuclease Z [Arcticibacter pallidicorallinus]